MKQFLILAVVMLLGLTACAKPKAELTFDPSKGEAGELTTAGGVVKYTAYRDIYYVTNVEDSVYQKMNIFVPENATQESPILVKNNVAGYHECKAGDVRSGSVEGRALAKGYVVVLPGVRGSSSTVTNADGSKTYTGRAPKGLLDLKAVVRYLRHFDKQMLGSAERIVTDGTSAGGAMSSLQGATGNNPAYEELLQAMGAAQERDDIFAAVCFCPITDLDHADAAYEWLYGETASRAAQSEAVRKVSAELAAQYPAYINSLNLKDRNGNAVTADNYADIVKAELIRSAQRAQDAGATIPDSIGFTVASSGGGRPGGMMGGPRGQRDERPQAIPEGEMLDPLMAVNDDGTNAFTPDGRPTGGPPSKEGGPQRGGMPMGGGGMGGPGSGSSISDLDLQTYLNYVSSKERLKGVPAFDSQMTNAPISGSASAENQEFGDAEGNNVNFTDYAAGLNGLTVSDEVKQNVYLLNPMNFIDDPKTTVAPHWYIRHGSVDRDTSFPVSINLAYKLMNAGKDVNYLLAWNRPHSGDYSLDELFDWLDTIMWESK